MGGGVGGWGDDDQQTKTKQKHNTPTPPKKKEKNKENCFGFVFPQQEYYLEQTKKTPYSFLASKKTQEMQATAF